VGHSKEYCAKREYSHKKKPFWCLNNLLMPFKCWINTTLCTETLSQIISSSLPESLNWEILGFAKVCRRPIWLKLCWARLYTWRLRFWEEKFIVPKQISGLLEWYFMKCFMDFALLNQPPSLNFLKSWKRQSSSSPPRNKSVNKQNAS